MGLMKDLDGLNAAYASMRESDQPMLLTKADKTGNTPAWRNRHKTSVKTGKPLYKMADHLKDEYEAELWNTVSRNLTELHELGGVKYKVIPLEEKQKDTPDQVKAVIAYDKARKGTDDATYDSEHGEKKKAKQERDYAKWQRDKGAEDAQKSGHPWKHAKGSTREKEGKKSEKHAHIKDAYNHIYQTVESLDVDDKSLKGVTKKEVKNLQKAAETGKGKYVAKADKLQDQYSPEIAKLIESGRFSEEEIKEILWHEGYQRNPEAGERKERASAKKREAIPGQASRGMPPRGDKKREEFEKWYAANVR